MTGHEMVAVEAHRTVLHQLQHRLAVGRLLPLATVPREELRQACQTRHGAGSKQGTPRLATAGV
ncbi:MAG: hypothetical protein R3B72_43385 [Polyangiaceae bacterium]